MGGGGGGGVEGNAAVKTAVISHASLNIQKYSQDPQLELIDHHTRFHPIRSQRVQKYGTDSALF